MKRGSAIVNTGSITGLQGRNYSTTLRRNERSILHEIARAESRREEDSRELHFAGSDLDAIERGRPGSVGVSKAWQRNTEGASGSDEEVAPAYVFFASTADSSYITGEILTLLGGETTAA